MVGGLCGILSTRKGYLTRFVRALYLFQKQPLLLLLLRPRRLLHPHPSQKQRQNPKQEGLLGEGLDAKLNLQCRWCLSIDVYSDLFSR